MKNYLVVTSVNEGYEAKTTFLGTLAECKEYVSKNHPTFSVETGVAKRRFCIPHVAIVRERHSEYLNDSIRGEIIYFFMKK